MFLVYIPLIRKDYDHTILLLLSVHFSTLGHEGMKMWRATSMEINSCAANKSLSWSKNAAPRMEIKGPLPCLQIQQNTKKNDCKAPGILSLISRRT